jgi:hypothetical protein
VSAWGRARARGFDNADKIVKFGRRLLRKHRRNPIFNSVKRLANRACRVNSKIDPARLAILDESFKGMGEFLDRQHVNGARGAFKAV